MESIQAAPVEPYSLRIRSSSFSSFISSNLDTESSASFFQDNSVPLGRLIGIQPGNGALYFPRRVHVDEEEKIGIRAMRAASSEVSGARRADMSQGICIPLVLAPKKRWAKVRASRDNDLEDLKGNNIGGIHRFCSAFRRIYCN
ncbi:hypothetical protein D5086_029956 [Populus alba]|uniref:Uncharacterized protein n=1 Tax=Populus alba TaxID=43335 RepID=A0ACC4AMD0_POPAL